MKRKLIYALLLAIGVSIFNNAMPTYAVGEYNPIEETFNIVATTGNEVSTLTNVVQTNDGGYIAIISSGTTLKKYDKNQKVEWERTYDSALFINSMAQLKDGSYVLVGSHSSANSHYEGIVRSSDGHLVRLDKYGNITYKKMFTGDSSDILTKVIPTSDGGFALAGYTYSRDFSEIIYTESCYAGGCYDKMTFIQKYDVNNNVMWSQKDVRNINPDSLVESINGSIVIAGNTTENQSSVIVKKFNYSGNTQWVKSISFGGRSSTVREMITLPNGQLILFGSETKSTSSGKPKAYLYSVDSEGNEIAFKNYNVGFNGYDYLDGIIETESGYTLYGRSNSTNTDYLYKGGYDVMFLDVDKDFNLIKTYNWGGNSDETPLTDIIVNGISMLVVSTKSSDFDFKNTTTSGIVVLSKEVSNTSIEPTITQLNSGKIAIKDNNLLKNQKEVLYRINSGEWTKYTGAFIPTYNAGEVLNIEAKALTIQNLVSTLSTLEVSSETPAPLTNSQNIDISFEKHETLKIELSKNTIDFGTVNGLLNTESNETIEAKVSSSLPWDMTITALGDFIEENEPENTLPADKLEIKANDDEYKALSKEGVTLLENQLSGKDVVANLKFKLKPTPGLKEGTYKISTKVNIYQK